jgi:hypothetical protein
MGQCPTIGPGRRRDVLRADGEEKTLDPADFEKLFELKQVTALTFVANEPEPLSESEPA